MSNRARHRTRIAVLGVLLPLAVGVIAVWAFWLRGDPEPDVTIREHGVVIERTTLSRATRIAQEQTGIRPVVPDSVPIDGLSLLQFDLLYPEETDYQEPAIVVWIAEPATSQPELVNLVITSEYPPGAPSRVPDGARRIDLHVDGVEAWEFISSAQQYLVQADGVYVYVYVGARQPPSLEDTLPMLRSIARQLQ